MMCANFAAGATPTLSAAHRANEVHRQRVSNHPNGWISPKQRDSGIYNYGINHESKIQLINRPVGVACFPLSTISSRGLGARCAPPVITRRPTTSRW
eukprot:6847280-Prymnesium_polylepis.1